MATLAGVPIQPVYNVPLKKWYRRREAVVGQPIDVAAMCSRFPTVEEMQKVSEYLREQELALAEFYETVKKR